MRPKNPDRRRTALQQASKSRRNAARGGRNARLCPSIESLENRTLLACLDLPSVHLPDLSLGSFDVQPPSLPNLNVALHGIDIGSIEIGFDTFALDLEAALGKLNLALGSLPVIGAQLPKVTLPAINIIDAFRVNFDLGLQGLFGDINLPNIDISTRLPSVLFNVFGPQGLNLLEDGPDAGDGISSTDVYESHGSDWEQFDMHLGQSYTVTLPLDLGLSDASSPLAKLLPNFDFKLAANNGIQVQFQWDLYLGMGFTTHVGPSGTGFYFNSGERTNITGDAVPELSASINVSAAPPKDAAGNPIPSNAPGLAASATMGLFQGSVTDGTTKKVELTSIHPIYAACTDLADTFTLLVSTKSEGTLSVPVTVNDTNFATFVADLNLGINAALQGKFADANPAPLTVVPQFMAGADPTSKVEATLQIISTEPDITGLEIQGASALGFDSDQFEDGRSGSLGFGDGTTSQIVGSNQVLTAALPAPPSGLLSEDTRFNLLVGGTLVPIVIHANTANRQIGGLSSGGPFFSDQVSLQDLLLTTIQNALSQTGFDPSKIQVGVDSSGRFVITALPGLVIGQSAAPALAANVSNVDTTHFSISASIDLVDPSYKAASYNSADESTYDRLYFTQLVQGAATGSLSKMIVPQIRADGSLALHTILGFSTQSAGAAGGSIGGPNITFDLDWNFAAVASFNLDSRTGSRAFQIGDVYFNNVQLDTSGVLNAILKPVAGVLSTITGPIASVVGAGSAVLNTRIPVISDLIGNTTLLSAAQSLTGADLSGLNSMIGFFSDLVNFPSQLASIPTDKPIGLGDWEFVTDETNPLHGKMVPSAVGAVVDSTKSLSAAAMKAALPQTPGFHLDLLDPSNIASMLEGNPFKIVSYGMPSAFHMGVNPSFSTSGSVNVVVGSASWNFGAGIDISVDFQPIMLGYDSTGLQEVASQVRDGQVPNLSELLDGVYLTVPSGNAISVTATASAYASIGVEDAFGDDIGDISGSGSIGLDAYLQIFNPITGGDTLRLNDIFAATNNFTNPAGIFSLFNVGADLHGALSFSGSVAGISIDGLLNDIGIPTSYSFSGGLSTQQIFGSTYQPAPQPLTLASTATVNGQTVLMVNAGPLSTQRKAGNQDDSAGYNVAVTGSNDAITVTGFGTSQTFAGNVSRVVIQGSPGTDTVDLSGLNVPAEFDGGGGNALITGGNGNDTFNTGDGKVTIHGGNGNDTITGGSGVDTIVLGNGNNTVTAGTGQLVLTDGNGNNTIDASASLSPLIFTTGTGADHIIGSDNNDMIRATGSGAVSIKAGSGDGQITANAGSDAISLGDGDTTLYGGSGNETITGGLGQSTVSLGNGNNTVTAGPGGMTITDGTGTNTIDFRKSAQALNLVVKGHDTVYGTNADDVISVASTGLLTFHGGGGDATVTTGPGNDTVYLGVGNNTVTSGTGLATVVDNVGKNTIDFSNRGGPLTFSTRGGTDVVTGAQNFVNTLTATGTSNITFIGGKLNDTMIGNSGRDTFVGHFGDAIRGGTGGDTFQIDGTANPGLLLTATTASQSWTSNTITYHANDTIQVTLGNGNNVVNVGYTDGTLATASPLNDTIQITLGSGNNTLNLGNLSGQATIVAGSGKNTLNATNLRGTDAFTTGGGGDVYSITGETGSLTLNPGSGTNTLNVSNVNGTLNFNETGTDAVTINNTQGTLTYAGTGKNTIVATDLQGTKSFTTGSANDSLTITNDPGTLTIDPGSGNDAISLNGISGTIGIVGSRNGDKTITGSNLVGNSTIAVGTGTDMIALTNVVGDITATAGNGANTITLTSVTGTATAITTGTGDDTVSLTRVSDARVTLIDGGSGLAASDPGNVVSLADVTAAVSLTSSAGNNTVTDLRQVGSLAISAADGNLSLNDGSTAISGPVSATANRTTGGGTDTIVLANLAAGLALTLGNGSNVVSLTNIAGGLSLATPTTSSGQNVVTVANLAGGGTITTGAGRDAITLTATTGNLTINSGDGGDVLNLTNIGRAADATTVNVGSGSSSTTIASSTAPLTFTSLENNGDTPSVTLNGNTGAVTMSMRSGNDTVTVNGGSGAVSLTAADGTDSVIINALGGPGTIVLGGGLNTVRTLGNTGSLSVTGGRLSSISPYNTALIVDRGAVISPLSGALGSTTIDGQTFPAVTGLGLGTITYQTLKNVEIDLGSSADQFTLNASGSAIPVAIEENGGDDQTLVNAVSSTTTIDGGTGNDTVIAEIPGDPKLAALAKLQLNVENLIVDNSSNAAATAWTYDAPTLSVGGTQVVTTTGAVNVNLLGGTSSSNTLALVDGSNAPQQLNVTRSNIRLFAGATVLSPNGTTPSEPSTGYGAVGSIEAIGSAGAGLDLLATSQLPVVTQVGPSTIAASGAPSNLQVIGQNLFGSSQVVIGSGPGAVPFVPTARSSGLLSVSVSAADLASHLGGYGTYPLTIVNSDGSISNATPITLLAPIVNASGLDAYQNPLPTGSIDPYWTVSGLGYTTAYAGAYPAWTATAPNANWISPTSNPANGVTVGSMTYTTTIDLTGYDPGSAALSGQIAVDNSITDIRLNGLDLGLAPLGGVSPSFTSTVPISIASGFVQGMNTLSFTVFNGGSQSGLLASLSVNAIRASSSGPAAFLAQNPTGFSTPGASVAVPATAGPVLPVDLNGDGKADLAFGDFSTAPLGGTLALGVELGNGDGTFGSEVVSGGISTGFSNPLAALASGDLNGDGKPDVVMLTNTGTYQVLLNAGHGTFTGQAAQTISNCAGSGLALGDFNGDGKLDAIVASSQPTGFYLLAGNGDGTFQKAAAILSVPAVNGATNPALSSLVAAPLARGGLPSVLASFQYNTTQHGLYLTQDSAVLLRDQGGSLSVSTVPLANGAQAQGFAAADFLGNGKLDLAVLTQSGLVQLYQGDGAGGFTLEATVDVSASGANTIVAADLDGDGLPDLCLGGSGFSTGTTLINLGGWSFAAGPSVTLSGTATSLATADIDGNGSADLVANSPVPSSGSQTADRLTFTLNVAQPRIAPAALPSPMPNENALTLSVSQKPNDVEVADVDGDGKLDLVSLTTGNSAAVSIFLGSGTGTFGSSTSYSVPSNSTGVQVADLNGDGKPDLIVYGSSSPATATILLNDGSGAFSTAQSLSLGSVPSLKLLVCDVTGDGKPDLIAVRSDDRSFDVYAGMGDGTFSTTASTFSAIPGQTDYRIADGVVGKFENNGSTDVALLIDVTNGSGTVTSSSVLVVDGNSGKGPKLRGPFTTPSFVSPDAMTAADLDGDGIADLIIHDQVTARSETFSTFLDPLAVVGQADWSRGYARTDGNDMTAMLAGDVNGDGKPDVVAGLNSSFEVLLNDGTGYLGSPITIGGVGTGVHLLALGDLNGDGAADLVYTPSAAKQIQYVLSSPVVVTGLSPSTATMGAGAFTLTVQGTGFLSSAVVYWNGHPLTTTYVSATRLTAAVPASDLQALGTAPVWVQEGTLGVSANANFTVTEPPAITLTNVANGVTFVQNVAYGNPVVAAFTTSGDVGISSYDAVVIWGDGTASAGQIAQLSPGHYEVLGSHVYTSAGTDSIVVRVFLPYDTSFFQSATTPATVQPQTIAAQSSAISTIATAAYSGAVATFTDNVPYLTAASYAATIHWGDGTTSPGYVFGFQGSFAVAGTHVYATPGTYAASTTITQGTRAPVTTAWSVTVDAAQAATADTLALVPTAAANAIVPSSATTLLPIRHLEQTAQGDNPFFSRFSSFSPLGDDLISIDLNNTLWIGSVGSNMTAAAVGLPGDASVAMSPDETSLYVLSPSSSTITRYAFTGGASPLLSGATSLPITNAAAMAFSADSRFAYVASSTGVLTVCTSANGVLTPIQALAQGNPGVDGLTSASQVVLSDDGASVYVVSSSLGTLAAFNRNATTGTLTLANVMRNGVAGVSGLSGLSGVTSATVTPAGASPIEYVFAIAARDESAVVFSRDPITGNLVFLQHLSEGSAGVGGLATPSALRVVATTDGQGHPVQQLEIASVGDAANVPGVALFDISQAVPVPVIYNTDMSNLSALTTSLGSGGNVVSLSSANLASVTLGADGGSDQITVSSTNDSSTTTVNLGGPDTFTLVSERKNATVTATAAGSSSPVVFNVASTAPGATTTLTGGGAADTFNVDGTKLTSNLTIDGGNPTTAPGDVLNFAAGGLTINPASPSLPAGSVNINPTSGTTYATVNFSNIETFNPLAASPIADAGGPYTINQGDTLTLSAALSNIPGPGPATFAWSVDGGLFGALLGATPGTLSWTEVVGLGLAGAGTHTVAVQVSENGFTSIASTTLTVGAVAPVLSLIGSGQATALVPYNLSLSASELDPNNAVKSWTVNWGDGSATETYIGSANVVSHAYALQGNYTVTVTATDQNLTTAPATSAVAVAYNALAMSGAASLAEGSPYALTLSDLGINLRSWTIAWGDGTTSKITSTDPSTPLSTTVAASHTYARFGSFTITSTATDLSGHSYKVAPAIGVVVTVAQVAPTVAISGGSSVVEGQPYTLDLSAVETSGIADTITGWSIDWGDGRNDVLTGNPSSWSHVYLSRGLYTITASATDQDGTYAAASAVPVAVTNIAPGLTLAGADSVVRNATYTLSLTPATGTEPIESTTIFWGDGSSDVLAGSPSSASHVYADEGVYSVSAFLLDRYGEYAASNSLSVAAVTVPAAVTIAGAASVNKYDPYTLTLSAIAGTDPITGWTIAWGDGSTDTLDGNPTSATHSYAVDGNVQIRAYASTTLGAFDASSEVFLTVADIAPTASIGGAGSIQEGASYTLALQAAQGSDPITGWTIAWGDGSIDQLPGDATSATHAFLSIGSPTITAAVQTNEGVFAATNSVDVTVNPAPPMPMISGPAAIDQGASYTLNLGAAIFASDSLDHWTIDWGDGSASQIYAGSALSAAHQFLDSGRTHEITATAVKIDGASASATLGVFVNDLPPSVVVSGDASVSESVSYTLNLSAVDFGTQPAEQITGWTIAWGDGTTQTLSGNPSSLTHVYADGGPFTVDPATGAIVASTGVTVSATAYEGSDAFAAAPLRVGVLGLPPTLTISGASSAFENRPYGLDLGASAAGSGATVQSIAIDWGDNQSSTLPGDAANASHVYAVAGVYRPSWSVTDSDGNVARGVAPPVTVTDLPPVVTLSGADSVDRHATYTLTLSTTAGSNPVESTTIAWGDGTTDTYNGAPASVTHAYANEGTYVISATEADREARFAGANTVSVTAITLPPTLAIAGGGSAVAYSAYTLQLTGVAGSDPITGWTIAWGDGSTDALSGDPSSATHTYTTVVDVAITATATTSLSSYAAPQSVAVRVLDSPPTATLSAPSSSLVNRSFQVSLANPSDPSPVDTAAGFRYLFAVDSSIASNLGYADASTDPAGTFAFTTPGDHTITERIVDVLGGYADYTAIINAIGLGTATSLSSPAVTYGADGIVTVTVSTSTLTPSGTVFLTVDGGSPLSAGLDANGRAVFAVPGLNAGVHRLAASFADQGVFLASATTGSLTVNQASATIVITPYCLTYDAKAHLASGTATGVGGVDLSADLALVGTSHTDAGTASDSWTFTDPTGNYAPASGTITDLIKKANAAVVVNGYTGPYDALAHGATGTVAGVPGDPTAAGSRLTLGASFTDAPGGSATWTFSGGTNYSDQSGTAAIFINQANLQITAAANSKTYDGTTSAVASPTASGLAGADTVTGLSESYTDPHAGTGKVLSVNAGFVIHGGNGGADYRVILVDSSAGTITPAALTITADSQTMTYGGAMPALTASYAGLVNGDTAATIAGLSLATVPASSHAGSYAITASGASNPNYAITLKGGTLTIGQAPLLITADNRAMTYGGAVPTLTASYAGLVNGDLPASLSIAPRFSTPATSTSPIGTYPITATGAIDPDYSIRYASGTLTITNATPTVTVTDAGGIFTGSAYPASASIKGVTGAAGSTLEGIGLTVAYYAGTSAVGTALASAPSGVGTYTALASFAGSADYGPASAATTFSIALADGSMVVLDPTGSGALALSGNARINVPAGGIVAVNSSSSTAIQVSGNAALSASAVEVVGKTQVSGHGSIGGALSTGVTPFADPLAGLAAPGASGLSSYGAVSVSGNASQTINPGLYSAIQVTGSGKLTMNPGVYVIAGGGFVVSGNASVAMGTTPGTAPGVFIYNAGSAFPKTGGTYGGITLSGNGQVTLSAMSGGPYAGILFFQARDNARALALSGNGIGVSATTPVIYAPAALVAISGNGQLKATVVADDVQLSGNAASTLDASGGDSSAGADPGQLIQGDPTVYIDDRNGAFTTAELADISSAVAAWDEALAPYNQTILIVDSPDQASIVLGSASTSAAGSMADGVIGCYSPTDGTVTIVQGWNFYDGPNASAIGGDQYDFQSIVTHELGHVLGLGHATDPASVMYGTIEAGQVRRTPTTSDLNVPDPADGQPDPLHVVARASSAAAPPAPAPFVPPLPTVTDVIPAGPLARPSARTTLTSHRRSVAPRIVNAAHPASSRTALDRAIHDWAEEHATGPGIFHPQHRPSVIPARVQSRFGGYRR